jgi:hypothetical protein
MRHLLLLLPFTPRYILLTIAVGIQSQQCHTDRCPGVATQDRVRQRALGVADKSLRVASFHKETVKALSELVAAAGLDHPRELRSHHFVRRATPGPSPLPNSIAASILASCSPAPTTPAFVKAGPWPARRVSGPRESPHRPPCPLRPSSLA